MRRSTARTRAGWPPASPLASANYLGVDPTIVRIVLAVLTVVGGAGIPVYMAGWLLMPDEGAPQSLASEFIGSLQGRSY